MEWWEWLWRIVLIWFGGTFVVGFAYRAWQVRRKRMVATPDGPVQGPSDLELIDAKYRTHRASPCHCGHTLAQHYQVGPCLPCEHCDFCTDFTSNQSNK